MYTKIMSKARQHTKQSNNSIVVQIIVHVHQDNVLGNTVLRTIREWEGPKTYVTQSTKTRVSGCDRSDKGWHHNLQLSTLEKHILVS